MSNTPGPELPGLRYLEHLGTGGYAEVYLYERDHPRIKVAVKVMKAEILDESQRRQFVAEADVMAELAEHPFIVPVLGAGTIDDGRPYLIMRYYPPPDLGKRVAQQPLSVPDALRTGIQLASAIETAHRAGIIHRDIKPSNVLMSSYGVPGLSDFGIAGRTTESSNDDEQLGVSMPWSPPEVLTGASNGSSASDVYSLAATIWNLIVGRSPFVIKGGDNSERALFTRILHSRPPSTGRAEVPGSLERLLSQAMAKEPNQRPQSALELARHLQRVEQELRLSLTEIVVLDTSQEDDDPPPRATPEEDPSPAAHTQVREVRPEPVVEAPAPAGNTRVRPPAATTSSPEPGLTLMRPKRAVNAQAPAPTSVRPKSPVKPTNTVGATVVRPKAATQPEEDADAGSDGRPKLLIGLATLGLIAIVIAGFFVFTKSGEAPKEKSSSLPNATTPTSADEAIGGSVQTDPPQISVKTVGGNAVFTWPQANPNDSYYYLVEGQAGEHSGNTRKVKLPIGNQPVCIQVHVVRDGAKPNSASKCSS